MLLLALLRAHGSELLPSTAEADHICCLLQPTQPTASLNNFQPEAKMIEKSHQEDGITYIRLYSFPLKLFDVIDIADPSIIRWINEGTAFKVFDIQKFESTLLPKYYRHNKFSSFQRQLNIYGFKRLSRGDSAGAYAHPKFLQNQREQVKEIK